jgi:hypothetical protein
MFFIGEATTVGRNTIKDIAEIDAMAFFIGKRSTFNAERSTSNLPSPLDPESFRNRGERSMILN